MFNIGDEVLCTSSRTGSLTGMIGVVLENFGEHLLVQFPTRAMPIEMFTYRFKHVDQDLKGLSPVCFKIRLMEKRWQKFQERKISDKFIDEVMLWNGKKLVNIYFNLNQVQRLKLKLKKGRFHI